MFLKLFRESIYIKNYYMSNMLLSGLFIIMGLFIPQYVIDFEYNGIFFMIIEYFFIFIFSLIFLVSIVMYLKSFFTKTFIVNRSETIVKRKKIIFIMLVCSKLFFYISIYNHNYYQKFSINIFSGSIDLFYLLYILFNFILISYFCYDFKLTITKKTPTHHWFENYLNYKQNKKRKIIEQDGKIISIYFKGFKLNELSNNIFYKGHSLKIDVFRTYMDDHHYKLNDLTDNDILMIKMIGI